MKRLVKTIVLAGISLLIGCKLSLIATETIEPILAIAFLGFPSGRRFIEKHLEYTFMFRNLLLRALWFCIRIVLSFAVGWIVLCLDLVLCIIELCSGKELV